MAVGSKIRPKSHVRKITAKCPGPIWTAFGSSDALMRKIRSEESLQRGEVVSSDAYQVRKTLTHSVAVLDISQRGGKSLERLFS